MLNIYTHPKYTKHGCIPETGEIINLVTTSKTKGRLHHSGYLDVYVSCKDSHKFARAHRFIWECVKGSTADGYEVDHINTDRTDNKLSNLRCITMSENRKFASAKRTDNMRQLAHKMRSCI